MRIGKFLGYLLYMVAVVVLSSFIVTSMRSTTVPRPASQVRATANHHQQTAAKKPKTTAGASVSKAGTPSVGSTSGLVNTGPASDSAIIGLFGAASLFGGLLYRQRLTRKQH